MATSGSQKMRNYLNWIDLFKLDRPYRLDLASGGLKVKVRSDYRDKICCGVKAR